MAGKPTVLAGRRLSYAMDKLPKNALIDLIVDRARAEVGAAASDEVVATTIMGWLDPVFRERGDHPVSLTRTMAILDASDEAYEKMHGQPKQIEDN
jgi:hypothetical protein